jgi:LysR family transcriptional regulator, nitrogen assimilation regulatory protein
LRAVVAIARHGGVSAAARALHVSQPALTLQLRQLEARLGAQLVERHSRGVTLTQAGAAYLEHAAEALEAIHRAEAAVANLRETVPASLNIGFTPTAGRVLAPDLLDTASREMPALELHFREGLTDTLWQGLAERDLAAAVCYGPVPSGIARSTPIYEEDLWVVGSAEVLRRPGPITPEMLPVLPLVLGERTHSARRFNELAAAAQGVSIGAALEVEPVLLKREILIRRGRCSIVPYGLFLDELRTGRLSAQPISPPMRRVATFAVSPDLPKDVERFLLRVIRQLVARTIARGDMKWLAHRPRGNQPLAKLMSQR